MRIAYITRDNPHEMSGWSGLTYFIGDALQRAGNDLSYIHSFSAQTSPILRLKQKIYPKLSGKFIQPNRYPFVYKQYRAQIEARLRNAEKPGFIFSNSSEIIGSLSNNIPKAFWTDASFAGMLGYYPEFSSLHPESIRKANQLEQKAYDHADAIFFSSDWAAHTAFENYSISEKKVHVVPFGANLPSTLSQADVETSAKAKSTKVCKLLFIGVYWERKGGPEAVRIVQALIDKGIPTELIIVGCEPFDALNKPAFVRQEGFVDKQSKHGLQKLSSLIAEAHFLILPTKADCTPVVFNEANSFGLPVLSSNVGGISSQIRNGKNGNVFEQGDIDGYTDCIEKYFRSASLYQQLAQTSYQEYAQRLNWDVAGKRVTEILQSVLVQKAE